MQTEKDEYGMTPLPNHADFEAMLRPRRPTEDGFLGTYDPWAVVAFSAKWCGPCQRINKKVLVESTPDVKWYSVDVDINKTTMGYCGLYKIPSFVLLKDGVFVDRKEGAASPSDILLWLESKNVPLDL